MHENKYYKFKSIPRLEFLILLIITAGLFNSTYVYDETYTAFYLFLVSSLLFTLIITPPIFTNLKTK